MRPDGSADSIGAVGICDVEDASALMPSSSVGDGWIVWSIVYMSFYHFVYSVT